MCAEEESGVSDIVVLAWLEGIFLAVYTCQQ